MLRRNNRYAVSFTLLDSIGHIANSDMDCDGVCFGNGTHICIPSFTYDKHHLLYHYHLSNRSNNTLEKMVNFTNTCIDRMILLISSSVYGVILPLFVHIHE